VRPTAWRTSRTYPALGRRRRLRLDRAGRGHERHSDRGQVGDDRSLARPGETRRSPGRLPRSARPRGAGRSAASPQLTWAHVTTGDHEGDVTPAGRAFARLLRLLGAPVPGNPGPGPTFPR